MRKKFLTGAIALSITAAACTMSSVITASVGTPIEVFAANESITGKSAEEVTPILQEIMRDTFTTEAQVTANGTVTYLQENKNPTLGSNADYDVDGTTYSVRLTIESCTGCDKLEVKKTGNFGTGIGLITEGTSVTASDVAADAKVTVKANINYTDGNGDPASANDTLDIPLKFKSDVQKPDTPSGSDTSTLGKAGLSSISVSDASMNVSAKDDVKEILVGVAKVNTNKKTVTVASWDTYDTAHATVDLSKLSNVKENYLAVSTPSSDIVLVKIPASAKQIKTKYDVTDGIQVGAADTGATAATVLNLTEKNKNGNTADKYEFRTSYSDWSSMDELFDGIGDDEKMDLSMFQEEGAKLFIRLVGEYGSTDDTKTVDGEEVPIEAESTGCGYGTQEDVSVYTLGMLPGKEAKVTIPAKAKGPKAIADYAKGTVKFPKNSEFRLSTRTDFYMDSKDDKDALFNAPGETKTVEEIFALSNKLTDVDKVDIEVRTGATAKKAASKWGRLTIARPKAFEDGFVVNAADVKNSILREEADKGSVLTIEYTGTTKNPKTGLKITNNGNKTYEFVMQTGTTVAADAKWKKVTKGKSVTFKGLKDADSIMVRVAGDKKTTVWVGKETELGKINTSSEEKLTPVPADGTNLQEIANKALKADFKLAPLKVAGTEEDITDQVIANETVAASIGKKATYAINDTEQVENVTTSITVAADGNDYIEVKEGKLSYKDQPTDADVSVVITLKLESGEFSGTKTMTVTVPKKTASE